MTESAKKFYAGIGVLFLITFISYSNVVTGDFIWDDDSYVSQNKTLRDFEGLKKIWFEPQASPQYYPFVFTIFWLEYHAWELNPVGYHIVNVFFHVINAILLWIILRRLRVARGFVVAALFVVHPVHLESVAWITELKNVLSGMFYLLSLLMFLKWNGILSNEMDQNRKNNWVVYGTALFFYFCALLSKTVTCSLPVAIMLILWWKNELINKKTITFLIPFFLVGLAMGLNTIWIEKNHVGAEGMDWDLSFIERSLIAGRALWFYAGKLVWPTDLAFSYTKWNINSGAIWQYSFPLAFVGLLYSLVHWRKKLGKGPLVGLLFFSITLFPALGFIDVFPMRYSYVADHFQYLASMGLLVLFPVALFAKFGSMIKSDIVGNALSTIVLSIFMLLSWNQGKVYKDLPTLYTDVIAKNPLSWMAHFNRGLYYTERKEYDRAIPDYSKTIEIKPDHIKAYLNRGHAFRSKRDFMLALNDYRMAVTIAPGYAEPYNEMGIVYATLGNCEKALPVFDKALQLKPQLQAARTNRSICYKRLGIEER